MPERRRFQPPEHPKKKPVEKKGITFFADIFHGPDTHVDITVSEDIFSRLEHKLKDLNMEPKKVKKGIIFVAAATAATALVVSGLKYKNEQDKKKALLEKPLPLSETKLQEFNDLTSTYYERVFRYVNFKLGKNPEDAADLTQKAFEMGMKHYENFEPKNNLVDPFYVWMRKIAENLVKNYYRDQSRRTKKLTPLESEEGIESDATTLSIYNHALPLQRRLEITEAVKQLQEKVKGLKDEEKLLVYLNTFEDHLSNRDIGEILGRSEGAIKTFKNRVKAKLLKK